MTRILLIEDHAANQELMVYLLEAFGCAVSTAGDGEKGIEAARSESPDLILCDLQLPRKNGYAVLSELRADPVLRTIPVVAVTAFAMVGDRDRILGGGFDGYIPKPIDPETFVSQVLSLRAGNFRQSPGPR